MLEIRTDLAIESKELYRETNKEEAPGVEVEKLEDEEYEITRVKILDEKEKKVWGGNQRVHTLLFKYLN